MADSEVPPKTEGLSEAEIGSLQKTFGKNVFSTERSGTFFTTLWEVVTEPMFLILIAACTLYFILGKASEGIMMFVAIVIVTAISLFQEYKSNTALRALQMYTDPGVTVVRGGLEKEIPSEELVPGDVVILEEGSKIPADAVILHQNDLTIDESILTGESVPVEKNSEEGTNLLFQGTLINTGKCTARITATGNNTKLGKLGKSVNEIKTPPRNSSNKLTASSSGSPYLDFVGFWSCVSSTISTTTILSKAFCSDSRSP